MKIKFCLKDKKRPELDFPEVTDEAFALINVACEKEPALEHPEKEHLQLSFDQGLAIIAIDRNADNRPVGYARIHPLLTNLHPLGAWYELGSTWVEEQGYRGQGIYEAMYGILLLAHHGKNILATTTNAVPFEKGRDLFGFVHVPRKSLPEALWKSTCFCGQAKTGSAIDGDNKDCKLAWGEPQIANPSLPCWIRVTKDTAERNNLRPATIA